MHRVSEIKLIRTDTTLDLSQKAEKVWDQWVSLAAEFMWQLAGRSDCGQKEEPLGPAQAFWKKSASLEGFVTL